MCYMAIHIASFIPFHYLAAMPKDSSTIWNRVVSLDESIQYFTIMMLAELFAIHALYQIEGFSSIPSMLKVFITNGY